MRSLLSIFLVLVGSFCVSACLESENPPCRLGERSIDQDLLGRWIKAESPAGELVVFREDETRQTVFLTGHEIGSPPRIDASHFELIVCRGKNSRFAALKLQSVKEDKRKLGEASYFPLRYEVSGETLRVFLPEYSAYKKAIENGKLQGNAETTTWSSNIWLSSSSEALGKWLDALGEAELGKPKIYHRPRS